MTHAEAMVYAAGFAGEGGAYGGWAAVMALRTRVYPTDIWRLTPEQRDELEAMFIEFRAFGSKPEESP